MSKKNSTGQIKIKEPRQRIVKELMAEVAPTTKGLRKVERLGKAGGTRKLAQTAKDPKESVPGVKDPKGGRNRRAKKEQEGQEEQKT